MLEIKNNNFQSEGLEINKNIYKDQNQNTYLNFTDK